jgi:hypothetical protein
MLEGLSDEILRLGVFIWELEFLYRRELLRPVL